MAVKDSLSLWPLGGFVNSIPRMDVPLNCLTGYSTDWLVGRKRLRRRAGSANYAGSLTTGVLESKWSAKCRRLYSVALGSLADGFPAILGLFVNEVTKAATLCFRSTNGAGSWRTVGKEYSATHYPATGVPNHRVIPMVYENQYGDLTLHRLTTAEHRAHFAAGSRDIICQGTEVGVPGYYGAPTRWNGRFNDATDDGSEPCAVSPIGLIPPLQMPVATKGNDLGEAQVGPFRGSDAFFFSVLFENEAGELSGYPIPLPPHSLSSGYAGFGYLQLDPDNPTHYFDSVVFSFIPDGPPGTRWKRLLRSPKVDVATTGAGAIVQPSVDQLYFIAGARIPQGQTTFTDTAGNDFSLDEDPRIDWLMDLVWPPRARVVGRFDGHHTLGDLKPNPYALIVAPWAGGLVNAPIDNVTLYGTTRYYVALMATKLVLRSVIGETATDSEIEIAGLSLVRLKDLIGNRLSKTSVTHNFHYGGYSSLYLFTLRQTQYNQSVVDYLVGDEISLLCTDFPPGTKITDIKTNVTFPDGPYVYPVVVYINKAALGDSSDTDPVYGKAVTIESTVLDEADPHPWGAAVVPGADLGELADQLLRTRVESWCNWDDQATTVQCGLSDAPYITPGMLVYGDGLHPTDAFAAGTVVTAVDQVAGLVTVSNAASRENGGDIEQLIFAYDTGDAIPGFVRAFGNAFPVVLPWRKSYLDRFSPDSQASIFSGGNPGHAQNAMNSWYAANRRNGNPGLGALCAFADLGPSQLEFYGRGRMRLYNPRTGLTHADADYTKTTVSWTRGARSPYAVCHGSGWAIAMDDLGFYVCGEGVGESPLSGAIYDAGAPVGERGELEYAIEQCVIASDSGTDGYKVAAQVHSGVLRVRYFSGPAATYFDREIRYDFSASAGKTGPAALFRPDGSPYPWSCPLTLRVACSAEVVDATGKHLYGAIDANAGAADGRIDELDTGTLDNGAAVRPMGYSGLAWPPGLNNLQVLRSRVVARKAGSGLMVGLARNPERAPDESEWDDLAIPTSAANEYVRHLPAFSPNARLNKQAVGMRIFDDGSGPCPEVTLVTADVVEQEART